MKPQEDSKTRFSERAGIYQKFRPSYPHEIADFVQKHVPLSESFSIADIGAGTGISTEFLIQKFQCHVLAIEPNEPMRAIADKRLRSNPLFTSTQASAEETGLPSNSINMVTAFQAFHWFDRDKTRREFHRILKSPKWLLFVWNERQTSSTDFLREYELLLQQLPDYAPTTDREIAESNIALFMGTPPLTCEISTTQKLYWESLKGRFFSSSYTPLPDNPQYISTEKTLRSVFDKWQIDGTIDFKYTTKVYLGQLKYI